MCKERIRPQNRMLIINSEIVLGALVFLGVPALVFLVVLAAISWWLAHQAGGTVEWRFVWSAAAAVLLVVVAVAMFETVAAYFRHEPPGLGHQYRQGDAYRAFIDAARFGFFLLSGVVAALGAGGVIWPIGRTAAAPPRSRWQRCCCSCS
jgi:hypothetical protein